MSDAENSVALKRRAFLRASGAFAAATTFSLPMNTWATTRKNLPISLLLPETGGGYKMGAEFIKGFQAAIKTHDLPLSPRVFSVSGSFSSITETVRQHLASNPSAAMLSLLSRNQATGLETLLSEARVPALICDIGADVVRSQHDSLWLIRHSLGYWQTNHAMGAWSAAHLGKRALIATDFLESGHDLVYAFHHGFVGAGGQNPGVHVNNSPNISDGLPELFATIRSEQPDFVYALYSGDRAKHFLEAYAQAKPGIPLAGPALLTQAADSVERYPHAENVIQATSWQTSSGMQYSPMALLGFEAALRLSQASNAAPRTGEALARALAGTDIGGPRGKISAHAALADIQVPLHVQIPLKGEQTAGVEYQLAHASVSHLRGMLKTGWTAPYLLA